MVALQNNAIKLTVNICSVMRLICNECRYKISGMNLSYGRKIANFADCEFITHIYQEYHFDKFS